MSELNDLTGRKFGRWIVQSRAPSVKIGRILKTVWSVKCDCGKTASVRSYSLLSGTSTSCGCLASELTAERQTTHGEGHSVEYKLWLNMIDRCHNPQNAFYAGYGGRGITVCEKWRNSVADFISDVGRRPSPELELDRKDNNGNYEPGNVQWATKTDQANNRRSNRIIEFNGQRMTLAQWAKALQLDYKKIHRRLSGGMSFPEAIL